MDLRQLYSEKGQGRLRKGGRILARVAAAGVQPFPPCPHTMAEPVGGGTAHPFDVCSTGPEISASEPPLVLPPPALRCPNSGTAAAAQPSPAPPSAFVCWRFSVCAFCPPAVPPFPARSRYACSVTSPARQQPRKEQEPGFSFRVNWTLQE